MQLDYILTLRGAPLHDLQRDNTHYASTWLKKLEMLSSVDDHEVHFLEHDHVLALCGALYHNLKRHTAKYARTIR